MTSSENRHIPGSHLPAPGKFYENKDFSLDLLPLHRHHPFTAGNKALKLRPHLRAAEELGIRHLLTFGGAYSHHLLAVAWACAERGWKSTGYVRGEELATQPLNPLLESARACGMELKFLPRGLYRRYAASGTAPEPTDAVVVAEGGMPVGQTAFAQEPKEGVFLQEEASLFEGYDLVICAAGTGTTAPLEIRNLNPTDSPAISRLSSQLGYPVEESRMVTRLEELLADPKHIVYVAEEAGTVVGWIHGFYTLRVETDPFVEIGGLVVDERQRGRRIGERLVERVLTWARERGVQTVRVRSNVVRTDGHRFYLRLGFVEKKEQKVFDLKVM